MTEKLQKDSSVVKIIPVKEKKDVKDIIQKNKKVIMTYKVLFETGKSDIEDSYYNELKELLRLLKTNPLLYLEIYGYADSRGDEKDNLELSKRRAENVLKYFNENGINTETAIVRGFGATMSQEEKTELDRQQNRRVDIKIFEYVETKQDDKRWEIT